MRPRSFIRVLCNYKTKLVCLHVGYPKQEVLVNDEYCEAYHALCVSCLLSSALYGQRVKNLILQYGADVIYLYHALDRFSRRQADGSFLIFLQKTGFNSSCKLNRF